MDDIKSIILLVENNVDNTALLTEYAKGALLLLKRFGIKGNQ